MNKISMSEKRLNEMIICDNRESLGCIERVLKAEITNVIKNYFLVSNDDVDLEISHNTSGKYIVKLEAKSSHIRKVKNIF